VVVEYFCFRKTLPVIEQPLLFTDAEAVWAKLAFPRISPIYTCSFYRPPNTDITPLLQLNSSSPPNIVIAGDFNLPSINWSDNGATILPSPSYGRELNSLCLELMDDCSLEQLVYQPTRQENILDIVLTTDPDMISDIDIVPGISDHEVICFDINLQSSLPSYKIPHFI